MDSNAESANTPLPVMNSGAETLTIVASASAVRRFSTARLTPAVTYAMVAEYVSHSFPNPPAHEGIESAGADCSRSLKKSHSFDTMTRWLALLVALATDGNAVVNVVRSSHPYPNIPTILSNGYRARNAAFDEA